MLKGNTAEWRAMMDIQQFVKESIAINACHQISAICQDFFADTKISYYNYVRIYKDNSRISLTNNYDWAVYFFKHFNQHSFSVKENFPKTGHSSYILWDNHEVISHCPLLETAKREYNIAHVFTIITTYDNYIEFQYFGAEKQYHCANNFYINHLDFLHSIGVLFREKAADILAHSEKEKIFLDKNKPFWVDINKKEQRDENSLLSSSESNITRYYLSGHLKDTYLTKREAQCLTGLVDGLTAKETAMKLNISFRTVQIHMDHIRSKLSCHDKSKVLHCANKNGFRYIHPMIQKLYF